ncbi:MAG TPA: SEC-C domain-containing protein, partial [Acidimicrobiales bacterium]|nr:SEC-C domain-containing protein [Acidimicrobiales bacterium]
MGWLVRTRPCPCGSGRAARDCCGRFKRLSEPDAGRAYVHRQARSARELLAPFSPSGMDGLRRELSLLPGTQALVSGALGGRVAGEVSRLVEAAARRDEPAGDRLISSVVASVGLPMARVALAKAV